METRRAADGGKGPRNKEQDMKRLGKFYAADRPCRKRLRTVLEFLKTPMTANGSAQDLESSLSHDSGAVSEFWADQSNSNILIGVLNDCVNDLETLYTPHENAFRKLRKKPLEAEDWNDVFEGLEVLIRHTTALISDGWSNQNFTKLFTKLLKRDNHAFIKKYAFRCLALYTDATRNLVQLSSLSSTPSITTPVTHLGSSRGGSIILGTEADSLFGGAGGDDDEPYRRKNLHLELLRESIDFSPYGGGSILLPDKFINEGVHVEGWMRPMPTQAEEPVDMLKFIMDLSLETEDARILSNPKINHRSRGDRFVFWCELIMKFYMPLLYPKVCVKVKLKEESDTMGFFHHCPGSFQRVVARWIYKMRQKDEQMEALWSRREFSEVVMETIRQRFAYRDAELVIDAIKFYSGICTGAQYVPDGMRTQMNETSRAMISHVSQLFHPSVHLEDPKILLHCIELLELISQRRLDDYTSTYLRKFVISTIDNCTMLRDPNNAAVLSAMISVVLHVWMHAAISSKATGAQVWIELTITMRRWLVSPHDAKMIALSVINCWKHELRFTSMLLMYVMDCGQSTLQITPEGTTIVPATSSSNSNKSYVKDGSRPSYLQSSANFMMHTTVDIDEATLLLDRVLHLIPPPTVAALLPFLHFNLFEGFLQLIDLWIDSAICCTRTTPTELQRISPSTIIALFGEWFLPVCELESSEYQNSRCIALVILCKLCSVRCVNTLTRGHVTMLARILFKGITSPSGVIVSTVLQQSSAIFTLNLDGMNALVPAYLHAIDQVIVANICNLAAKSKTKVSEWNKELTAALDVVFSIMSLPTRYPDQNFVSWHKKLRNMNNPDDVTRVRDLMRDIPETRDDFYVIIGRILLRVADLPFTDIIDIKKKALWGIFCLSVINLTHPNSVSPVSLTEWIVFLIDACHAMDFSLSMTSLNILQDLSDFHEEINSLEPILVARVVMTLAVFAQRQVEEASIEVQAAIENAEQATDNTSRSNTEAESLFGSSGIASGARQGSGNRQSRLETGNAATTEATDPFSKLKNKLKAGALNSGAQAPLVTPAATSTPLVPPNAPKEQEIPALKLIVQKTSTIFECLRFWVMHRPDVLEDTDVKKLLFSAIEAALVGTLPDGEWQEEVKRAREHERQTSMPLLFLGLQMRASLNTESSQSWLKSFEETAVAAEGLLMHLLHHLNGFPSPAGVDQMTSNCSELYALDDFQEGSESTKDAPQYASAHFVFMNSIIFSVIGSLDSPCARFVARDMTGLFTWEITAAVSSNHAVTRDRVASTHANSMMARRGSVSPADNHHPLLNIPRAEASVRVELKPSEGNKPNTKGSCPTCGGESPRKRTPDPTSSGSMCKIETQQVSWDREERILSNSECVVKNSYVYHDDSASNTTNGTPSTATSNGGATDASSTPGPNQQKKPANPRGVESDKATSNGSGSAPAQPSQQQTKPAPKRCECQALEKKQAASATKSVAICGLFDMSPTEANVGSLDDERSLLDLVLDSIPMVFRDCSGDTADKTLLGGRYAMLKYQLMDINPNTNPLLQDSAEVPGFSFLQRLIHDDECYVQLKAFLVKDGKQESKELVDFCDSVKKYERSTVASDRLGQASVIYWEFLTIEGGKALQFPPSIGAAVQTQIQQAQQALKSKSSEDFRLPGTLFQQAMSHMETHFEKSGLLDKYVAELDQAPSSSPAASNAKEAATLPPQLTLFDSFSIMELNVRILQAALAHRAASEQVQSINDASTRQIASNSTELLLDMMGPSRVSHLDICRLFLSQSGLLPPPNGDVHNQSRLKLLEQGPKVDRSLKHLDQAPTRETMKIGVLYVGRKQRTQQEILQNDRGSRAYEQFLDQLGWEVDLTTHKGFLGGLDSNPKSLSNGRKTLYYATSHSEVVFHVVSRMPTKEGDMQQIDKKRHVGNDYVHIVWSENDSHEYDPSTITSHFNDVQVVIYPLRRAQEGLYLVQVYSKAKVPPFGPLQSGMVVHAADLARLVRQTTMNANRVCRAQVKFSVSVLCVGVGALTIALLYIDCCVRPTVSDPEEAGGRSCGALRSGIQGKSITGDAVRTSDGVWIVAASSRVEEITSFRKCLKTIVFVVWWGFNTWVRTTAAAVSAAPASVQFQTAYRRSGAPTSSSLAYSHRSVAAESSRRTPSLSVSSSARAKAGRSSGP